MGVLFGLILMFVLLVMAALPSWLLFRAAVVVEPLSRFLPMLFRCTAAVTALYPLVATFRVFRAGWSQGLRPWDLLSVPFITFLIGLYGAVMCSSLSLLLPGSPRSPAYKLMGLAGLASCVVLGFQFGHWVLQFPA